MTNPRDIFLQQFKPVLDSKSDNYPPFRAVLKDSNGLEVDSVWKDENARLVWFRAWGGAAPAWALCDVLEPTLGLGVYIKFNPDINQYEVLRDDPLMRSPDSDRTSYRAITNQDLLKGGRFQLWLDPTMFIALSIYPTGADTVNVVSGDYIFQGERKTYDGVVDQDISGSRPAAGLHRFVGFYLDSSNALNTIDGDTIATGTDAPEPSWPADIFRIGVVDIDNATDISIDDIDNRKVIYTEDDETGITNVWPRADEVNINYTAYAAWALALDALLANEQAIIGEGTYLSDDERLEVAAAVKGSGIDVSILSTTTKDRVLTLAKVSIILEDFTLSNIYSATIYGDYYAAYIDENANIDAFRVKFVTTGSGANINYGCYIASAGTHRFAECIWNVQNGTANYALYIDAQGLYSGAVVDLFDPDIIGDVYNIDGTLNIYGGKIDGDVCDGGGCTINLYNLPIITGTVSGGTINGYYIDGDGIIHPGVAWPSPNIINRWDVSTGKVVEEVDLPTAVSNSANGDTIILGDGTYTITSSLTVNKSVLIKGSSRRRVFISGEVDGNCLTVTFGANFEDVYIENYSDTGPSQAVICNDTSARFRNCELYAYSPDDNATALELNAATSSITMRIHDTIIDVDGSGIERAISVDDATLPVSVSIYDGIYQDDLNFISNSSCYLHQGTLESATPLQGAGNYYGEYLDDNGVTRYIADTTPADAQFPKWDNANSRWVPGYVDELWESDGGAVAWETDASGDLSSTNNDIFPNGDNAGVDERTDRWLSWSDEFTTWSGYTWDAVAFGGTPSSVSVAIYNSLLVLYDNSATNYFAYKSTTGVEDCHKLVQNGVGTEIGIRFDDEALGVINNYLELKLVNGTVAGFYRIANNLNGVVTYYADGLPAAFYTLRAYHDNAGNIHIYYGYGPEVIYFTSNGIAWTPTRVGIRFTSAAGGSDRRCTVDKSTL